MDKPLDPKIAAEAWVALSDAQRALRSHFQGTGQLDELSLSEFDALNALAAGGGIAPMAAIEHSTRLTQPATSRLVSRLEARGLVSKCASANDAREREVQLTEAGESLRSKVAACHGASVAQTLSAALSDSEAQELIRLTRLLAASLSERPDVHAEALEVLKSAAIGAQS